MIYIALLIALLFPSLALGVPTEHDAAAASITGGPTSFTIPLDLTGCVNCFIVAGCVQTTSGASNMVGVTWNGSESFTSVANVHDGDSTRLTVWNLVGATAGFFDAEIEQDNSQPLSCGVIGYSGVHQTTPYGAVSTAFALTSGAPSVNVTATSGDLIVDFVGWYGPDTGVVGGGQSEQLRESTADATLTASGETGAAGTITMSWTNPTVTSWLQAGFALKPSAAVPTVVKRREVIVQ